MTNSELNRDIKRLLKSMQARSLKQSQGKLTLDEYFRELEQVSKPEFLRLYNADRDFTAMNKTSALILLRLNVIHRFEPLHQFGISIDLDKLN